MELWTKLSYALSQGNGTFIYFDGLSYDFVQNS
jgi:hypothetical protein